MLVADRYLGPVGDVAPEGPLEVVVDDTERRRSRFRTTTECGRELGVVVARDLEDGDVLDADGTPVVVTLDTVEAVVVPVGDLDPATAAELGHAVGNRHWDLAVRGDSLLLPVAEGGRVESEVRPHLPDSAALDREQVSPARFDGTDHDHTHGVRSPRGSG